MGRWYGGLRICWLTALLAVLLSVQSAAAADITVSKVRVIGAPEPYCPKTVTFRFMATATKAGTYHYRHVRSDGTADAAVRTISFATPGKRELPNEPGSSARYTWQLLKGYTGWVGVHFESPSDKAGNHTPNGKIAYFREYCPPVAVIYLPSYTVSTSPNDIQMQTTDACQIKSNMLVTFGNKGNIPFQPLPSGGSLNYSIHCDTSGCYNNGGTYEAIVPAVQPNASVANPPMSVNFSCPTTSNPDPPEGGFVATPYSCPASGTVCQGPFTTNFISTVIYAARAKGLCPTNCQ